MKSNTIFSKIIKIYLLVLSVFFVFRVLLFFTEIDRIDFEQVKIITIIKSFVMGIRFDMVVSSYIMALPSLVLLILDAFKRKFIIIEKLFFYWILLFFSLSFSFSAMDIPYFNQFFSRLTIGAFAWMDNLGFVFNMIIQEPTYFLIIIPLIIIIIIFKKVLKRIFYVKQDYNYAPLKYKIPMIILFLGIVFFGLRGRLVMKSPIRIGTAYFCDHSFLNQLGLNPNYTLLRSYLNSKSSRYDKVTLMEDAIAISKFKESLHIPNSDFVSPIAREIYPDTISDNRPNIVLVTMESMSAAKMKRYGNTENLTPFLDGLVHQSLYFDNIYTAGKHTFNGVFSTLYSYPALYRRNPLRKMFSYYGMSSVLKDKNYSTTFFINHDAQFDNIEGFLRANDFDNVIGQKDYPSEEIKTSMGVPDDYMFRHAMPILDKFHKTKQPFFVSFMTASDHGPFYIPEYFTPHSNNIKKKSVEYADWSLRQLIELSSKKEWFENTIFILIADHGEALSAPYDISMDYHHSPLIIYAPKMIKPIIKKQIGGQIDVFPTVMGLLKMPYINNTFGIDLLKEQRPYIFVNDDDKVGVVSDSLFLIMRDNQKSKLHKYKNNDLYNYVDDYPNEVKKMEEYVKFNLQTYQYMLLHSETLQVGKK